MATVRLSQEIKTIVRNKIFYNYKPLIEAYGVTAEETERLAELAKAQVQRANTNLLTLKTTVRNALKEVMPADGEAYIDNMTSHFTKAIGGHTQLVLKDTDTGQKFTFYWVMPSQQVLAWEHSQATVLFASDYPEVKQALAQRKEQRRMEEERDAAIATAAALMDSCTTLAQLVKKWPGAKDLVPQKYIDKMNDKTAHLKRKEQQQEEHKPLPMDTRTLDSALLRARAAAALQGDN